MTEETHAINMNRVPAWLVQAVDDFAERMDVSRSAAALALLAVGWHNATVDTGTREGEPDVVAAFRDKFDTWEAAGGKSAITGLDDLEYFLITEVLPGKHGGKRPGAGRPKTG